MFLAKARLTVYYSFIKYTSREMITQARHFEGFRPLKVHEKDENGGTIDISFEFDDKMRHFSRKGSDTLQSTLVRIGMNLFNPKKKKQKSKTKVNNDNTVTSNTLIELRESCEDKVITPETTNSAAWEDGSKLHINETVYRVFKNAPFVSSLHLSTSIMAGFPVFPSIGIQHAEAKSSTFQWYVPKTVDNEASTSDAKIENLEDDRWKFVGEGFTFTPNNSLVGSLLKISCIPSDGVRDSPFKYQLVARESISPGPGVCPFEERQLYTYKKLDARYCRVVSYNILADIYASGEFAKKVLFPYCPDYVIDYHYRRQLILKELRGYNADLICLQECDVKCFEGYLSPALESDGYEGAFKKKGGETSEGEAIFFRADKFSFVDDFSTSMRELLLEDCCKDILNSLEKIPDLLQNFNKRKTIVQAVVLQHTESRELFLVLNTHLYYKPTGGHIRLLQTAVLLRHLDTLVTRLGKELNEVCIILCGDLNSMPGSAVIHYIFNQKILPNNEVWRPENAAEAGFSLPLSHKFDFNSACGLPEFTNYVQSFQATLDYIFVTPNLGVEAVVPLPTEEEIQLHNALPSVVSPSDHLALICDLKLKSEHCNKSSS